MSITLKVGGVYRTREGERVVCMRLDGLWAWFDDWHARRNNGYGRFNPPGESRLDIVAEWTEEPIWVNKDGQQAEPSPRALQVYEQQCVIDALIAERDALQQELERVSSKADENARTYFAEGRRFASAVKERDALRAELEALKPKPRTGTVWLGIGVDANEKLYCRSSLISANTLRMALIRQGCSVLFCAPHTWTEGKIDGGEK